MSSLPQPIVCEFTIEALHGEVCVDGRNCRADLTVGTRFTAIVEYAIIKKEESNRDYSVSSEEVRRFPIDCRVAGIESYRRDLDCLASGMTARLTLEGVSRDQLAEFAGHDDKGRIFVFRSTETEPNQALEPTTLSVTFCAPSRTDRAS